MVVRTARSVAGTSATLNEELVVSERIELTTVTDTSAVFHIGIEKIVVDNLDPDSEHTLNGITFRTLPRPSGKLLSTFCTVNDVHFGETVCGMIDDNPQGPILRSEPGAMPYPVVMNSGAIAEMKKAEPHAVFVKGDLTNDGLPEEFVAFDQHYIGAFGDSLYVVRGNHDAYRGQDAYGGDQWVELPGANVALMDTTIVGGTTGMLEPEQLEWLGEHASKSTQPVLVMGHHQQWIEGNRSDTYFGMHPDCSDALSDLVARHASIVGYTAGHTHRHRVRMMDCGVPSIEIGCVKDFPGTWAEYRVYEGGIMQVVHRISTPDALEWSNKCRVLYSDFGVDYQEMAMGELNDRCFVLKLRT